jgi:hypothetical protein
MTEIKHSSLYVLLILNVNIFLMFLTSLRMISHKIPSLWVYEMSKKQNEERFQFKRCDL